MIRAHNSARLLALALRPQRIDPLNMARSMIVLGCALALIMAGQPIAL